MKIYTLRLDFAELNFVNNAVKRYLGDYRDWCAGNGLPTSGRYESVLEKIREQKAIEERDRAAFWEDYNRRVAAMDIDVVGEQFPEFEKQIRQVLADASLNEKRRIVALLLDQIDAERNT